VTRLLPGMTRKGGDKIRSWPPELNIFEILGQSQPCFTPMRIANRRILMLPTYSLSQTRLGFSFVCG
jgi:hypothetical protein